MVHWCRVRGRQIGREESARKFWLTERRPVHYVAFSQTPRNWFPESAGAGTFMVDVAQLVRAPVCGTGGRGFETLHPP